MSRLGANERARQVAVAWMDAAFARKLDREWDEEALDAEAYASDRAHALYAALGASRDDDEYSLCLNRHEDRWALVGMVVEGHRYAVEVS